MTPTVIDVSRSCQDKAAMLRASGVQTVARYYSRDTIASSKRLTAVEAQELARAGLRLCIVYEGRFGEKVDNFDKIAGIADGKYARSYAHGSIGQPAGSAIWRPVGPCSTRVLRVSHGSPNQQDGPITSRFSTRNAGPCVRACQP